MTKRIGKVYVLLGAGSLVALAALEACSDTPAVRDEGAFVAPPGFTVAQTAKIAASPEVFVRDGDRVVTVSAIARATSAATASANDDAIEAHFLGRYGDGVRMAMANEPSAYVDVMPVGASSGGTARVRRDGALVAFEEAFPHVTAAYGGSRRHVEEFLSIPTKADVPPLTYRLVEGPSFGGWEEAEGALWGHNKEGGMLFRIAPPSVEDATGKVIRGSWVLEEAPGGSTIRADLAWDTLTFPVVFDPSFETPTWYPAGGSNTPSARSGASGAFYAGSQSCSVIFGGINRTTDYLNDVGLRCGGTWRSVGSTVGLRPTGRAYGAMTYGYDGTANAGAYLFGGNQGTAGVTDELWRLTVSDTPVSKTATWVRLGPPAMPAANTWPPPRYLAHLSWNGSALILYGGVDVNGAGLTDTWQWNPGTQLWSQICTGCFLPRYGSANAEIANGGSFDLYAIGGYDTTNATGTGYTNTVQKFTGTTWVTTTFAADLLATNQDGSISTSGATAPPARYLHWAGRTTNNLLAMGSGIQAGACTQTPPVGELTDAWTWQTNTTGGAIRWERMGTSNTSSFPDPGARISATTVFESASSLKQLLVFGGTTDCNDGTGTSAIASPRVLKAVTAGSLNGVTLTATCNGGSNGGSCPSYNLSAAVTGIPDPNVKGYFLQQASNGTWSSFGCGSTGSPLTGSGGSLSCSNYAPPAGTLGIAVRVRDGRYSQTAPNAGPSTCARTVAATSQNGGLPECNDYHAFAGTALCTAGQLPGGGAGSTVTCGPLAFALPANTLCAAA